MTNRPTTDHDRAALKAAFRKLMRAGGGGVAVSEATRVGQQHLSRYGSVNHPNDHAPLDVVADVTIDSDDAVVVRALCRLANGVFVPLPRASAAVPNWPAAVGTAVKRGEAGALALLGFEQDCPMRVGLDVSPNPVAIGNALALAVSIEAERDLPVMVDYRIQFHRPGGRTGEKVFKLKQAKARAGVPLNLSKSHKLKAGASTFTLHPGPHRVIVQVNGQDKAQADIELM